MVWLNVFATALVGLHVSAVLVVCYIVRGWVLFMVIVGLCCGCSVLRLGLLFNLWFRLFVGCCLLH